MTFRYPITKTGRKKSIKVSEVSYLPGEVLTGLVKGKIASDGEERIAIGLDKLNLGFGFQFPVETKFTLPDREKKVDFVVYKGIRVHPIEFYGEFWHSTAGDKSRDEERERQLNEVFLNRGWEELKIIRSYEAYDQITTDGILRGYFT